MKPVVGAMQAWSCVVISVFAIVILSVIGTLYRSRHHEFVGGIEDPDNTSEVSSTIFTAVIVYAVCLQAEDIMFLPCYASQGMGPVPSHVFLVCCGLQGVLHMRENRRGAIAL
ncbi:hypothetical protein ONZ43_g6871 [Nemania bipapillata]|uniref:Uncharacterized protein n=1 Tax=Nemania bipapillata TaxID=110536 RepID=A0ACC2HVM4_9PEZI|nr:hypothetical protein ONZ43_g6871 [Nemania bipapillata]